MPDAGRRTSVVSPRPPSPDPRLQMAWLQYGSRLRKLPDGVAVLGSGDDATLLVDDVDLMPRHLIVHPRQDHVEVSAFSPDVVVVVGDRQVGSEPCRAAYGAPIRAGAAEFRIWKEQPAHRDAVEPRTPTGFLIDLGENVAYPLDRLATSIGRASTNVVRLTDPTASRFHATIRREAGGHAIHVIGSAGGTVNGRRVANPCMLSEGDVVEMAYASFRYTRGPVPPGTQIVPLPGPDSPIADRPTMARERISLGDAGAGRPPEILRTAVVVGLVVAVAAAVLAVLVF
jgi:hypothetical protein